MRLTGRLALTLVVVLLVGVQSAEAMTRAQATAVAKKALKPATGSVLNSLPKPAKPGTVIGEGGPGLHAKKVSSKGSVTTWRQPATVLKRKSWVFWLDQAPGAEFEHPSVLLIVDDKSARVTAKRAMVWWPIINNKRPAFARSAPVAGHAAAARPFAGVSVTGPPNMPNDCMITIGDRFDPLFDGDFKGAAAIAKTLNIPMYPAKAPEDIDKLLDAHPECKDALIVIAGHGAPKSANTPRPTVHLQFEAANAKGQIYIRDTTLTSDDIRSTIKKHADRKYKFLIQSCFAGRWNELRDMPQVQVMANSSQSDQFSYGYFPPGTFHVGKQQGGKLVEDPDRTVAVNPINPEKSSSFMGAMVHSLDDWAHSDAGRAETGDDLAKAIRYAFEHSRDNDAGRLLGWYLPVLVDNIRNAPAPPTPTEPTPTQPTTTNLPKDFSTTWTHGSGTSRICVYVTGDANAQGDVTVNGTLSPAVQVYTDDSGGRATVMYTINQATTYNVSVRWPNGDGTFSVKDKQTTVSPPPTNGPPAPDGFAACPAP